MKVTPLLDSEEYNINELAIKKDVLPKRSSTPVTYYELGIVASRSSISPEPIDSEANMIT